MKSKDRSTMKDLNDLKTQLQEIIEKKKIAFENQQFTYMAFLRDQEREIQDKIRSIVDKI